MILPTSLLLALPSFAMTAPIYKWIDAEGVARFGAQPPQGARTTTMSTQTAPPPNNFLLSPSIPVPATQQKPTDSEQKAIDDKVKQQAAKEKVGRKQFCEETCNNPA